MVYFAIVFAFFFPLTILELTYTIRFLAKVLSIQSERNISFRSVKSTIFCASFVSAGMTLGFFVLIYMELVMYPQASTVFVSNHWLLAAFVMWLFMCVMILVGFRLTLRVLGGEGFLR